MYCYRTERVVSMIDMSQESQNQEQPVTSTDVPWQVGFSETSGERNK